jgi:hypothetical protein
VQATDVGVVDTGLTGAAVVEGVVEVVVVGAIVVEDEVLVVEAVVVVVTGTVVVEVDDGVWPGTGCDGVEELVRTFAAAAVTPPTIRTVATAVAASLRADAPIRGGPFSCPLARSSNYYIARRAARVTDSGQDCGPAMTGHAGRCSPAGSRSARRSTPGR